MRSSRTLSVVSRRLRQAVASGDPLEVALVEQLDLDLRVELPQLAELPVLPRDERLLHHGHLEIEVLLGEVEVGRERLDDLPLRVALEDERRRLVEPRDAVVVEDLRVLELGLVD